MVTRIISLISGTLLAAAGCRGAPVAAPAVLLATSAGPAQRASPLSPPEWSPPPALPEPSAVLAPKPRRSIERTTMRLRGGLFSPMPGGYVAGYRQDTGLDIGGFRLPVYAVAAGTLDYSEPGHTRWPGDDDKAVRLRLDAPIPWKGRLITHVWYAHLHELTYLQPAASEHRIHVVGGERLGTSGIANRSPHLHLGFLLDGQVSQRWGTYLLEDEIRLVLGKYRKKERLPLERRRGSRP